MVFIIKKGDTQKSILNILKALEKKSGKGIDIKRFLGKIKLNKDALALQNDMRNEWS